MIRTAFCGAGPPLMFSEPRRGAGYPSRAKRATVYALQSGHTAQSIDLCVAQSGTPGLAGYNARIRSNGRNLLAAGAREDPRNPIDEDTELRT